MFWVGFVGMAAATLYFLVERNSLDPEYRSVATVAALVTFVAAIHYYRFYERESPYRA
nr:bacteriorhodopsin [Exiguobacterium sp. s150]